MFFSKSLPAKIIKSEYFGVDYEILWDVAIDYLPENKIQVGRIIEWKNALVIPSPNLFRKLPGTGEIGKNRSTGLPFLPLVSFALKFRQQSAG